jgi:histidyl-tRNA synthetase
MATFQTLPGFREFYPEDFARRNHIFRLWRQTAGTYGFAEYDAPVLEPPTYNSLAEELLRLDRKPTM